MLDTPCIEKVSANDASYPVDSGSETTVPQSSMLTPEQERNLYRKIDLRLMPILSLMYLFNSMDRGNIGNAYIAGLTTQLKLVGNDFNFILTMSSIPFCLCEFPANLLLQKIRPSRWLPGITITWGIIMTLSGLVKTYPQLVGARVLLGVAEAGLFPGAMYYLTLWYPRHALQFRIGLFIGISSFALAFSGLLAFGIGFLDGKLGLKGWSWIFILEGTATVLIGIVALIVMVDSPATAAFLTPEERAFLLWKKKYDSSSAGEQENFAPRYVWAAVFDWQVWLHILIFIAIIVPLTAINIYLPSIILGYGHSTAVSQLLTVPVFFSATIMTLCFGHYSDKFRVRFPFVLAGLLQLLVGFSLQISATPRNIKYFGTFLCVSGGFAALPGAVAWLGNNLAGQCKRGAGMAIHIGIGNFGVLIASNIFRARDAPRYIFGHTMALMFVSIGLIIVPIVAMIYARINAQRNALARGDKKEALEYTIEELREMGDRAPNFRYTI